MRPEFLVPEDITRDAVADMLMLVGVRLTYTDVCNWTRFELIVAMDWATREHLRASENLVRRRDKPSFVTAAEQARRAAGHPPSIHTRDSGCGTECAAPQGETMHLYHHRFPNGEEFGLYRSREDADKACDGKPGAEVISLAVLAHARAR